MTLSAQLKSKHLRPCGLCGSMNLSEIYDFGYQPVAGYLEDTTEAAISAPRFQNTVAMCTACGFVQQAFDDSIPYLIEHVYAHYQPTYSMSSVVRTYMSSFINTSITQANLEKGALVLEIGSNDGSVLAELQRQGFRSLGLDPSANQDAALRNGYEVVRDFFSEATAITLRDRYGRPGLILSRHTLEHVFEPMDFMRGIAAILDPDGIAAIEVPYLHTQLINNQFQSMTFQHISFFTATAMFKMASDVGLEIKELTFSQMDGGSIVVLLGHSHTKRPRSTNVDKIMAFEKANKLDLPEGLATYFVLVSKQLEAVRRYVNDVTPGTFVAFGAGSKGQALLNMLKLDCTLLPFVIDETPGTCGRFIPGVGTEITDLTDGRLESSELLLVTAPTHIPEIVRRAATRFPISMPVLATAPALHFVSPIVC